MNLVDTHSHIYLPEFDTDLPALFERCDQQGVSKILLPAIDSSTHKAMINLASSFPRRCLAMMGMHPCSVKENFREELKIARNYLETQSFVAIGETGLDLYWDLSFISHQYEAFHEQVDWALEFNIPLVIHSRNATDECIAVVKDRQKGKLKGVFHCFSGTALQAKQIMDLGFYLGIGGVVTFKNGGLDKVMKEIDLDKTVLETDAPYLSPVPFRGKRNEPSYLQYIVAKLSEIKNIPVDELAKITSENAIELFDLY